MNVVSNCWAFILGPKINFSHKSKKKLNDFKKKKLAVNNTNSKRTKLF